MPDSVSISAHAKFNAFLRVLSKEDSGYHGLETVFSLLELSDSIEISKIPAGIELNVEGEYDTGPVSENLVFKAAELVLSATGNRFGVKIHLNKTIPVQAGLGGGSSDAAATLHAVNALADAAIPRHELLQIGAKLGSDVPFFVSGAPVALAWNHGERLLRLPAPPQAPALVIFPKKGVSTAHAYARLDRTRQGEVKRGAVVLDDESLTTWGSLGRLGGNDFESVTWEQRPDIRDLFEKLVRTGPTLARLCGSGAALVGIYKLEAARDAAMEVIGEGSQRLIRTATRSTPAVGPVA